MEAVTAAERADAEERALQMTEALRAELAAEAEASVRDTEADAERRSRELEEAMSKLAARVQVGRIGRRGGTHTPHPRWPHHVRCHLSASCRHACRPSATSHASLLVELSYPATTIRVAC